MSTIEIQSLNLIAGDKILCSDLSFTIKDGESWALLGKNGAGKTTLIHSIAGLANVHSGTIRLKDKALREYDRIEMAKEVGVLFQEGLDSLPATVLETVLLGRHPHTKSIFHDSDEDLKIAKSALRSFELEKLGDRPIDSLSGGEKQRVALAMLITQAPNVYLLDEPSNHLDIAFQVSTLKTLQNVMHEHNASMLMATHDINLAARFCNRFVLLSDCGEHRCGNKEEILDKDVLSEAYNCKIDAIHDSDRTLFFPL